MSKAEDLEAQKNRAVVSASVFYHYKLIARSIGIDDNTLLNWRKDDDVFEGRLSQGRSQFIEAKIKVAKPEFLLERLEPELFKERKETDLTTKGDSLNDVRQLTDEELEQKIEQYINARKAK